jgi:23S rRNA pseudouridine2605 synthase
VFVNGQAVRDLATRIEPGDTVVVDGKRVRPVDSITLILNKPRGFLTSREDELDAGRETVYDLLPKHLHSLHYVGRLDRDSEGLLVFTNSGDLTEKLTHPRHGIEKEYLVAVDRVFDAGADRQALLDGFRIDGGFARALRVEGVGPRVVALTLTQGIKRQIRLMFEGLGYKVTRLQRVRIGTLVMPELKSGRWRVLTASDAARLLDNPVPPRPEAARRSAPARNRAKPVPAARRSDPGPAPRRRTSPPRSRR